MSPDAGTMYLIIGSTGAGKTTYAIALAKQLGAVRFSIDEWMTRLFWMDSPTPIEPAWAVARIDRCEAVIASQVRQLVSQSVPCVLDLGFTRAEHRAKFTGLARDCGAGLELHYVEVSADERWRRVSSRNAERGETFQMNVDRTMFDFMESIWEAPGAEEMKALNGIVVRA